MQSTIARHKLASYPPDFLIEIPSNAASVMEFDRADELIELGEVYGRKCVKQMLEHIANT